MKTICVGLTQWTSDYLKSLSLEQKCTYKTHSPCPNVQYDLIEYIITDQSTYREVLQLDKNIGDFIVTFFSLEKVLYPSYSNSGTIPVRESLWTEDEIDKCISTLQ